jgi:hypothetical protein
VSASQAVIGFVAALLISVVTAPVGISGAVFLLPVQLSILQVPTPSVTPTNLLFNVVATPGSLLRYRKQLQFSGPLTRHMVVGTLPGVIAGAAIHVYLVPGPTTFRIIAAAVLIPIGCWLLVRSPRQVSDRDRPTIMRPRTISVLAFAVGCVAGIYGLGGGSILGPILVGSGMAVAVVAPAALASTFVTSLVGVLAYGLLALTNPGTVAPNWVLGLVCGAGGLIGGYLGARLQPRLPERALRVLLGALAVGLGLAYLIQATITS